MKINGSKLKWERQKKGISQQMLADAIELTQGMVSMLENGVRNLFSLDFLYRCKNKQLFRILNSEYLKNNSL